MILNTRAYITERLFRHLPKWWIHSLTEEVFLVVIKNGKLVSYKLYHSLRKPGECHLISY